MKLACSGLGFAHLDLDGACRRISELGFGLIDLMVLENWVHINPSDLVRDGRRVTEQTLALLTKYGLRASGINTCITTQLSDCTGGLSGGSIAEWRAILALAGAVGSPVVTHQPGQINRAIGFERSVDAAELALLELAGIADGEGVQLALELHGHSLVEQIETALRLVQGVRGLAVTLDPSHFACMEIPLARAAEIMPYVRHVHLRNGAPGTYEAGMAEGTVDFPELKRLLEAHGYEGYAAIEYISSADKDVSRDIIALKRIWEASGSQ